MHTVVWSPPHEDTRHCQCPSEPRGRVVTTTRRYKALPTPLRAPRACGHHHTQDIRHCQRPSEPRGRVSGTFSTRSWVSSSPPLELKSCLATFTCHHAL